MKPAVVALVLLVALGACDPGSTITITPQGTDACAVSMRPNSNGIAVDMTLACAGDGQTECYTITALTCQAEAKTLAAPIAVDDCPGASWCVADCAAGLEAPGTLWDVPSLKAVEGCNTYED